MAAEKPILVTGATLVFDEDTAGYGGPPGQVYAREVTNPDEVKAGLMELGVPRGLAQTLADEDAKIGLRIYLLDNSGSTAACDGNILRNMTMEGCSRWEEICHMAEEHARWNMTIGVPCEFLLLNCPAKDAGSLLEGRDYVHLHRSKPASEADQLASLRRILDRNGPRGVTPMTKRVNEIHDRIKTQFTHLINEGQYVFFTIATDGMPTAPNSGDSTDQDQRDFVKALRDLCMDTPVQLVIRLCTDDDKTVDFYNKLDEELELPLDILDDICGEAKEIYDNGNRWLAYTPLMHKIREAGSMFKLLDLLDERALVGPEIQRLVTLLSGSPNPLPTDSKQFCEAVAQLAETSKPVFDARLKRNGPFVNVPQLRGAMGVGGGCCTVM